MAKFDVTTRSKNGQWVNEVEGANELSRSFGSRIEAISEGSEFAHKHSSRHAIEDAEPSGGITDGGAPGEAPIIVGDKPHRQDSLPETTDENGFPLENPAGG
ncbi:DUF2188 domain-containing protein [Microbacterium sp. A84]|uniref:DUF2188 domain-containing protein n=1 Tax=Microbacterium sp. A84 TaxID=3450715 RepID=UPI003F4445A0